VKYAISSSYSSRLRRSSSGALGHCLRAPLHGDLQAAQLIFDFLTFFVMLVILNAGHGEFRTGWFVESLATQTLVIFLIAPAAPLGWRGRAGHGAEPVVEEERAVEVPRTDGALRDLLHPHAPAATRAEARGRR